MESQKAMHSNNDPEKEEQVGGIMLPNIKLYYEAIVFSDFSFVEKMLWSPIS